MYFRRPVHKKAGATEILNIFTNLSIVHNTVLLTAYLFYVEKLNLRKLPKEIVVSLILPKNESNFFSVISALASKKWLNKNIKELYYVQ